MSGTVTDPESTPDENCSVFCKSSGVAVSCRHLHHLLVQHHLPRNRLRPLLCCFPAEGAFIVAAKSIDLKNQETYEFILEMQKQQMTKVRQQHGLLHGHFHWDTQCACLQLQLAQFSLAVTQEMAFSSEGHPRRDPAVQHPPDLVREPGLPPCRNSCGKLSGNVSISILIMPVQR